MAECNICYKRVLSHANQLQCKNCQSLVHIRCLPFIDKNDSIYKNRRTDVWFCTKCTNDIFPFNHYDDNEEFLIALSDSWQGSGTVPFDKLSVDEKIFVPFEINENCDSPLDDIDPDLQYYVNNCNPTLNSSDYYLEESFNKKLSQLNIKQGCVSMIHLNIRSAVKNMDKFEAFIANLNHEFSIVALSETWLKPHNENLYSFPNYQSEHNIRKNRGGGGVSILIKNGIEYCVRADLKIQSPYLESLFIEIQKGQIGNERDVIIGVIYRPPNTDVENFNDLLVDVLSKIKSENKSSYLLGDYNINLLNCDNHTPTQNFIDNLYSNSFFPSITKPTRVTHKSATLIDNIFQNSLNNVTTLSGILYTDISDHFPIFHIDYTNHTKSPETFIQKRIYSSENMRSFSTKMQNHDWSHIYQHTDPQSAYTSFFNDYCQMYHASFPMKRYKTGYKTRKAWMDDALKRCIKMKNKMYRNVQKTGSQDLELVYKKFRNKVNKMIFIAQKNHYDKLIADNRNNMKKSWRILKEIVNKKQQNSSSSRFLINNKIVTDKKMISNGFNSFLLMWAPR